MRKYIWILVLFILLLAMPTVSALSASEVEFENMPLAPGDATDLWIYVRNDGSEELKDVVLTLDQSAETQTTLGILDGSVGLGDLDPRRGKKARFTIYAAPDAEDGIYNFDIRAKYSTFSGSGTVYGNGTTVSQTTLVSQTTTLTTISVQVLGDPPYVVISKTSDNIIAPGTSKDITVTVRNVGTDSAKDVFIEVNPIPDTEETQTISGPQSFSDISDIFGGVSGTVPGMSSIISSDDDNPPPFVVKGSGTRFFVGDLGPGISREITFWIFADSGAMKGVYNLPITIHRRNGRSTSEYIGVIVTSKAELNVPDIRTDPKDVLIGDPAILMVTIENVGKNDAKSARVLLMENQYISGTVSNYVGTISPDEDDTALFEIQVLDGAPEVLPVTFQVTYQDETGVYSFVERGDINVKENSEEVTGPTSGFLTIRLNTILIVLILIVIAISIWNLVYFRRSRRSNKSEK